MSNEMQPSTPDDITRETTFVRHARVRLALHRLRPELPHELRPSIDVVYPLLLLHGLGDHSPMAVPDSLATWPGAIWALDFSGHGESSVPAGGGYTCEVLMADADAALATLGPCTVYGRGLGGYVGLLIAGARSSEVRGVIIDDGNGLQGGGIEPGSLTIEGPGRGVAYAGETPDPFAMMELASDIRPPDYAASYVRLAVGGSQIETPIVVVAVVRPPWLAAITQEYGVVELTLDEAIRLFRAS